jgi:hypothetical protein
VNLPPLSHGSPELAAVPVTGQREVLPFQQEVQLMPQGQQQLSEKTNYIFSMVVSAAAAVVVLVIVAAAVVVIVVVVVVVVVVMLLILLLLQSPKIWNEGMKSLFVLLKKAQAVVQKTSGKNVTSAVLIFSSFLSF